MPKVSSSYSTFAAKASSGTHISGHPRKRGARAQLSTPGKHRTRAQVSSPQISITTTHIPKYPSKQSARAQVSSPQLQVVTSGTHMQSKQSVRTPVMSPKITTTAASLGTTSKPQAQSPGVDKLGVKSQVCITADNATMLQKEFC